jgi:3-isopropylmalate/(R)-2-methylmalate dehydratase small subunit
LLIQGDEGGDQLKLRGRVWLFGDNINTDLMYPGFVTTLPEAERAKYCMNANRPGWSEQVKKGDIIVGGRNFGCGSSRSAAKSLKSLGVSCVLADSMNGLFFRNAINFGLPALSLKSVSKMFEEGDTAEVDFQAGQVHNLKTREAKNAPPLPQTLIHIVESGGLIPLLEREGYLKASIGREGSSYEK